MMNSVSNFISFSGKVPIGECVIKKKGTREDVDAICYEYDCKSKNDIENFKEGQSIKPVPFNRQIEYVIKDKLKDPDENKAHRVYTLETKDGSIVANAHIEEIDPETDKYEIKQIGANKLYGLAGRMLIAQMGKEILKNKPDGIITVFAPVPDAVQFYTQNCKFKYDKNYILYNNKSGIDEIV